MLDNDTARKHLFSTPEVTFAYSHIIRTPMGIYYATRKPNKDEYSQWFGTLKAGEVLPPCFLYFGDCPKVIEERSGTIQLTRAATA